MSKVDDELTRRLRGAERPVDGEDLFEGLARRRSQRERVRRTQTALLAFAVLAATGGGFLALRSVFGPGGHQPLTSTAFGADGAVVACGDPTGQHLCLINAQALLRGAGSADFIRLTGLADENVSMPSVSRDGTTVVFDRSDPAENGTSLWTVAVDGSRLRRLSHVGSGLTNASWGPDGSLVAVASAGTPADQGAAALAILDPARAPDPVVRTIALPGLTFPSTPRFSPDGKEILFAAGEDPNSTGSHLYTVTLDGRVTERGGTGAMTPDWSPDGTRVVFSAGTENGVELFVCPLDCSSPRALHDPSGDRISGGLPRWSPDADWIAYRSESGGNAVLEIIRVDGSEVRSLVSPADQMSWIAPPPEATASEGRDIGFGFLVCQVSELAAQFDGEGAQDTAVVATRLDVDGRCPSAVDEAQAYVGMDLDHDGSVDTAYGPISCEAYYCRVFAAPDLNGDGDRYELLVVESAGSVVGLGVYSLEDIGSPPSETTAILRIEIGDSDYRERGFITGEPARLFIGGDEGWSYRMRCEDQGGNRFLYVSRAYHAIDESGPWTVDETTLYYANHRLNVFDARESELSMSDDPLGPQPQDLCGTSIPQV
jgi:WD40-like Beta Propeller Repeat